MAKKTNKKVSRKRQSKKLPLLGYKKKPAKKARVVKRRRQPGLRLRIGRHLYLKIALESSKLKKPVRKDRPSKKLLRQRQRRKAFAAAIITLGVGGVIYFGLNLLLTPKQPVDFFAPPVPQASSATQPAAATSVLPKTLVIPDINVATSFVTIGKQTDGTMDVPKSYDVSGWYRYSPLPGEIGPAVIVGHVDSKEGPAVFWRLRELKPGQLIVINRTDGKTAKFKVTNVEQFDQDQFPTERVYGNIDYAGLRVITCGGWFERSIQRYSHNTVVFATMVI